MANPTFKQLTAFTGDTFGATFIMKDENEDPIDISIYESVHLYIYKVGKLDSPLYDYTIGDGLNLSDNTLTFEFTPDQIAEIAKGVYYWRFQVTYSGSKKESFLTDRFIVNSERSGAGANDGTYTVTVDSSTTEVTFSVASASVSAALALQAKTDAETARDETEQIFENTEDIITGLASAIIVTDEGDDWIGLKAFAPSELVEGTETVGGYEIETIEIIQN